MFEDKKPLNLQDEHDNFKEFRGVLLDFVKEQELENAESVTLDFAEDMSLKAVTIIKNQYCDPIIFEIVSLISSFLNLIKTLEG